MSTSRSLGIQHPALHQPAGRAGNIREHFRKIYGESCQIYRAPGRINLIGEHTDYNGGFVMPAAIDFHCWIAIAPAASRTLHVYSANLAESRAVDLDHAERHQHWSDYVQGVAVILENSGQRLSGARILIDSEVPIGSGLSSSAALEVATGFALLDLHGIRWELTRLALACQRAENEFVGARCGIMDQFVSCYGKTGQALMLDCRSLECRFLPIPADIRLVICNTMVKHAVAAGEYNTRRWECEEGVRLLAEALPGISSLRDVSPEGFERCGEVLPSNIRKRCGHVITENERVQKAAMALEQHDLRSFGELMAQSHRSLRDDYEVSCPELDLMVELAHGMDGVYGARMMGGGFGGCTINLVAADAAIEFKERIAAVYGTRTGMIPEVYIATAGEGVGRWEGAE